MNFIDNLSLAKMTETCYYENEKRDMQEHTSLVATTSYKN
ncbi:hypothetical protein HMPREF9518_01409 [Enterococcus faecalis TX1342]|nr:hypothetical protein HMPREF9518_01409 [Enterococcus faecalis TX1342]